MAALISASARVSADGSKIELTLVPDTGEPLKYIQTSDQVADLISALLAFGNQAAARGQGDPAIAREVTGDPIRVDEIAIGPAADVTTDALLTFRAGIFQLNFQLELQAAFDLFARLSQMTESGPSEGRSH